MKQLIPKLAECLALYHAEASKVVVPKFVTVVPKETTNEITHTWFWPHLERFFKPKDLIVTETGTSNFGILDVPLPEKSVLVSQLLWGSIRWSVGSMLGAAIAVKEVGLKQAILFVRDGSMKYNDISNWEWTSLFKVLGDLEEKLSWTYTIRTKDKLSMLLKEKTFASANKIQLVEVMMDKLDVPGLLNGSTELGGEVGTQDAVLNPAKFA
ncbi:hypothetical protein DXG03_008047 [Asterophora parasitica]|uniref:Uncharacterized protein n=1 Tax=Asterophora parasitica TaxID=117018 RepID=A0A9P7KA76_9AGAR|nr:hypothetical protein DXG03_008047 [Asterophora parasitica]